MKKKKEQAVKPGEIKLDYLPFDWPLTPLGANKDPYVVGWQNKPFTVREIEKELLSGDCKAIGLLGGPVYNHPYGLVWVDVDGESVYPLVKELAQESDFDLALPPTLTICSGKLGRERKLYRLSREKQKHFVRNKYTWHAGNNKEKLEILWSRHQGVLMGLHPNTEGYYTAQGMGFEWADRLPELPAWIVNGIINKNNKQGIPATETTRFVGPNFALNAVVSLDCDIKKATDAMWSLPEEAADDYDIWIMVGQSLHNLDESLLEQWDAWSQRSEKYKEGECHRRWLSFNKGGGRGIGSLIHTAKQHGWVEPQDHKAMPVDDSTLDQVSKLLKELEEDLAITEKNNISDPLKKAWVQDVRVLAECLENEDTGSGGGKQKSRGPSADLVASVVMQMYEGNLHYSLLHDSFFIYEHNRRSGLWCQISDVEMRGDIKNKLDQIKKGFLKNGYNMSLINDVMEQLRITVIFDDWYEGNELLLFRNGVLNIRTKEFTESKRSLYITQQLPYEYDPGATCEPIIKWLKGPQDGNWERTQVLRAWLRAVLLGYSEIRSLLKLSVQVSLVNQLMRTWRMLWLVMRTP